MLLKTLSNLSITLLLFTAITPMTLVSLQGTGGKRWRKTDNMKGFGDTIRKHASKGTWQQGSMTTMKHGSNGAWQHGNTTARGARQQWEHEIFTISNYINRNRCSLKRAKPLLVREMLLCQLLCANCDWESTRRHLWNHKAHNPHQQELQDRFLINGL